MNKSLSIIMACLMFAAISSGPLFAQDLTLAAGDLRIEQRVDGGFHLFVRQKPELGSVLLTESTRDPLFRAENYAYRAIEWNTVNGDEVRVIDGYPIAPERRIYSLIDSTPEWHPELGWAYHIYIPYIIQYGYTGGRNGEVYVVDGTYLNIRAFYYSYGDYRGPFRDNPFVLKVTQRPLPGPPEGNYMQDTIDAFTEIAGTNVVYSTGPADLVEKIRGILEKEQDKTADIVICMDTTGSMRDDIAAVRLKMIPMLRELTVRFPAFRIGMILYKDYHEEYITREIPFTSDFGIFQRNLNAIKVGGGRDIPEAVYEALYAGAVQFPWEAEARIMILIGDAPPHPRPRGKTTKEMVNQAAAEQNVQVHAIILPQ
ncbi:MAG: VWA domain-containing protein [Treponema sp.]|jgi:hypothetical protein|nr:VWA domain-containing protein [Treponema sp.]